MSPQSPKLLLNAFKACVQMYESFGNLYPDLQND